MGRARQQTPEKCTRIAQTACPLEWGGFIIRPTDQKCTNLHEAPDASGIYAWYTKDAELMYVGRSTAIRTRLIQHDQGTVFWGGKPTYYSYREVPSQWVAGVENAHIRALGPMENRYIDSHAAPFSDELERAIEWVWRDVLPIQRARLDEKYTALAEQIAARL